MKVTILNKRVQKEIIGLGVHFMAEFERTVKMMQDHGTFALGMPHVRKIQNPLWEIRMKDSDGNAVCELE